jgi:hypothetical protein
MAHLLEFLDDKGYSTRFSRYGPVPEIDVQQGVQVYLCTPDPPHAYSKTNLETDLTEYACSGWDDLVTAREHMDVYYFMAHSPDFEPELVVKIWAMPGYEDSEDGSASECESSCSSGSDSGVEEGDSVDFIFELDL